MSERAFRFTCDVAAALAERLVVRGAVDWSWRWHVRRVKETEGGPNDGWLVWAEFTRPEVDTLAPGVGVTRKEFVPYGATESALFKTAFVVLRLTVEHELMEGFHVDGCRVFNPHHSVGELAAVRGRVV